MIMSGLEFMGEIPFDTVYFHGTVRDDIGRKMSKSLGNSIDPLGIIEKYSADALRFSLLILTATGQDVQISDEKFEIGRNFGTKIWNAARFMQMNSQSSKIDITNPDFANMQLSPDDHHILAKLSEAIGKVHENLERYRFNDAALAIYDFMWHHFCDWYVEYSKSVFYGDNEQRKMEVECVMNYVFSNAIRLLHPFMPFITEELWHGMGYNSACETIMRAPWPKAFTYEERNAWGISAATVEYVDAKHDLIRVGRTLRADYELKPKQEAKFAVRVSNEKQAEALLADINSVKSLLRASEIVVDRDFTPEGAMPSGLSQLGAVYMSIEGLVDIAAEIEKLTKRLQKVQQGIDGVAKKLSNEKSVANAPQELVASEEKRRGELVEKADKIKALIETLSA